MDIVEQSALSVGPNILVRNLHDEGKTAVTEIERLVEPDLLYPLLRGRDIRRWSASPSHYILMPQDPSNRRAFPEDWLKAHLTRTYEYFQQFESDLINKRKTHAVREAIAKGAPFYSMFGVGSYTVAKYKVCWPELADNLNASVVGPSKSKSLGNRTVVPDHTVCFVPFEKEQDAHYCSAVLNSSIAGAIVAGYITMHPSPHILENIRISKFDRTNPEHRRLASLSVAAHEWARKATEEAYHEITEIGREIDQVAARLWKITDSELKDIQFSLADLT